MSRPVKLALEDGLISPRTSLFDYGCGRGGDVRRLRKRGISASGWDPALDPDGDRAPADVVNIGYVINVIEDIAERGQAIQSAWDLAQQLLIVSAQIRSEVSVKPVREYSDGFLTSTGTFQRYYDQSELRDWIQSRLGVEPLAAGPGIFYVFRDRGRREEFTATRFRRREGLPRIRKSDRLYEEHKSLLEPLIEFFQRRGRLPKRDEVSEFAALSSALGSVKRAWRVVLTVTGPEQWSAIEKERAQDLLLYMALAKIRGRSAFGELPAGLRGDVRTFFGSYREGCRLADQLLFSAGRMDAIDYACRHSGVGKLMPNALYIHESALTSLPILLRVYEGCARTYIGHVDGANIIKLHRRKPQISYLAYPEFDVEAHPALTASMVVPLSTFHVRYDELVDSPNPPILHRKEDLVCADYPERDKFEQLTREEEDAGLYADTASIGRQEAWQSLLNEKGLRTSGHQLIRVADSEAE